MEFKSECPFIEIKMDHFHGDVLQYAIDVFKSFKELIQAVKEIVEDKMPEIVNKCNNFKYRMDEIKEYAGNEIKGLGLKQKAEFGINFAYNAKQIAKIPPFVTERLENLKASYEEVKAVIEELKANQDKLRE